MSLRTHTHFYFSMQDVLLKGGNTLHSIRQFFITDSLQKASFCLWLKQEHATFLTSGSPS